MGKEDINRVPRALTNSLNSKLMDQLYDLIPGTNVVVDLIVYLSRHQIGDLFGESWFSIQDFCKIMGYDRTTLGRKLSKEMLKEITGKETPIYIQHGDSNTPIHYHNIETVFEAALYKLTETNLMFPYVRDGVTFYTGVQVIDSFAIKDDFHTKKGTKRLYSARLSKKLADSLFYDYNLININDYRALPNRHGYKRFYLQLSRMISIVKWKISKGEVPFFTQTVDDLAYIFDINVKENKQRKKQITKVLNAINDKLTTTKFQYEYIKGINQRYAYTVKFYFSKDTLDFFNEEYKAVFTDRFFKSVINYYLKNIAHAPTHEISKKIQEIMSDHGREKQFHEWFYSEADIGLKRAIYIDEFRKAFGKSPEDVGFDPKKFVF